MSGKRELISLEIDPEAVDPEDVDMLSDMVIAAVNEALRQGRVQPPAKTWAKLTGGLNIPGF